MTIEFSTGLRDFINSYGSLAGALSGGTMQLWSGSAPASPDDAATGTLLCQMSNSGLTFTKGTQGTWTIAYTSGTSDFTALTAVTDTATIDIIGGTITWTTDWETTAALIVAAINRKNSYPKFKAWYNSTDAKIYVYCLPSLGTKSLADGDLVITGNTMVVTNTVDGLASTNGINFDASGSGSFSPYGTWSGTNLVTGQAGYFRIVGPFEDSGTSTADSGAYNKPRIQGTCGVTGADYIMSAGTTLTVNKTHTLDTGSISIPEEV